VGPKPDGTIPEQAKNVLLAMGRWLSIKCGHSRISSADYEKSNLKQFNPLSLGPSRDVSSSTLCETLKSGELKRQGSAVED
jgi:hypothetical protein